MATAALRNGRNPLARALHGTAAMTAIAPPPVGSDTEPGVARDNKNALAALQHDQAPLPKRGSLLAVIGSVIALGLVGFAAATVGAKSTRFRRPWYARLARR
ncbi:MAG: hypothetical protein JWP97_5234 [Labilithrix sp.]|nr:hypothetical protein [Labilithrix sp.]